MLGVIYIIDGILSGFRSRGLRGVWLSPKPPESPPPPYTPMQTCHMMDYNERGRGDLRVEEWRGVSDSWMGLGIS